MDMLIVRKRRLRRRELRKKYPCDRADRQPAYTASPWRVDELAEGEMLLCRRIGTVRRRTRSRQTGICPDGSSGTGRYVGSAFINSSWPIRERLWKRVQEHAGSAQKGVRRPATQWVKPGIIGRVKHVRGEEDLRHASLQDFREE
ncbi:hypothetical protein MesoLj113a_18130 [Mesorhizobium sp. 113-1-2]|nr:hypothetical protein MesoLj113a_18130 [Mesorhizobium sp. 113-1-2]